MTTTLVEAEIMVTDGGGDRERPLHIARIEGVKVALCGYVGKEGEPWQEHREARRRGVCVACWVAWSGLPDDQRPPINS